MLFVSCQPYENENFYTSNFILNMARAAKLGGAKGLRIEGIRNINFIKNSIDLPIIGMIKFKSKKKERYITSTKKHVEELFKTKCKYIAIDYTFRDNLKEGYYLELAEYIHKSSNSMIIADISTIEEAEMAYNCGVDLISTTLRGYTKTTKEINLPDIDFIEELKLKGLKNIIAEGGYSTHNDYINALNNGAKIVVIGTAITRPHLIIKKIISGHYY